MNTDHGYKTRTKGLCRGSKNYAKDALKTARSRSRVLSPRPASPGGAWELVKGTERQDNGLGQIYGQVREGATRRMHKRGRNRKVKFEFFIFYCFIFMFFGVTFFSIPFSSSSSSSSPSSSSSDAYKKTE